ncbi:HD domain-containing protein [Amycolatopsis sp. NPDC049252]|uniref:HD domain-containing protein n=1 Tax=Amycolatopsis sp. NPDC049252 TaxID=3363933 RepID=UPI00371B55F0
MTGILPDPLAAAVSPSLPTEDVRLLEEAYRFAARCHREQTRKSGDPYLTHPVEVAAILARQGAGTDLVCAALLHDTAYPADRVRERFGPGVADLLTGLARLEDRGDVASASDDVLRLKLADRLHNMRTIEYVAPARQRVKSAETLRTLVQVAARLSLTDVGLELSALASGVLHSPAPAVARGPSQHALAFAAVLLPRAVRARWLAEWAGELAALPTARRRAGFVASLVVAMPGLSRALRRTGPRAQGSGATAVLSGIAVVVTALNSDFTWPAAVVAVTALAVLTAVLFTRDDRAAARLHALIRAWRRRR